MFTDPTNGRRPMYGKLVKAVNALVYSKETRKRSVALRKGEKLAKARAKKQHLANATADAQRKANGHDPVAVFHATRTYRRFGYR